MANTPNNTLAIEELSSSDYAKLSELHDKFFAVKRQTGFWRWKYEERPAGRAHVAITKTQDGAIVGQSGRVDFCCSVKGTSVLAAQAQDIVILEQYRSGRTFFNLEKEVRELCIQGGVAFDYGFAIEITKKISTRKLGFTDIGSVDKMVHLVNLAPYLRRRLPVPWIANLLGAMTRPLLGLRLKRPKHRPISGGAQVEVVEEFDGRFDRLWEVERERHAVIMSRSADWLNWRYTHNPVQRYKTFALSRADKVLGFMVVELKAGFRGFDTLQVEVNDAMRGEIVDYLADSDADLPEEVILDHLLDSVLAYFIENKVDVISAWCLPHMQLFRKLARIGFRRRKTPNTLIVRCFEPGNEAAMDIENWYFTHGDKDCF